ncbi:MAG: methionyl-tRNA formyltransferase [Bacilli bacterium]|nr:methionyl-tRNA formyltransferase [Bacilli bacterium]
MNIEDIEIKKELVVIFMGTPEFSVEVLDQLNKKYKVRAVVTKIDKPVGRKGIITKPPVKKYAEDHAMLVLQPTKIKDSVDEILSLNPDLIVTCAYGQILPKEILEYPRYGCINVHASLLPKLRGGAPIHRAILNDYKKTGITIMYMAEGMDDGDIITQSEIEITDLDTAETLHDKLSKLGASLLVETLPKIIDGTCTRTKQNESEVTFGLNIKREDEKIDFSKTKRQIYNQIRGLNSFPGAYCMMDGKILKVWSSRITDNYYPEKFDGQITNIYLDGIGVKVGNGEIVLTEIQPEGKRKMLAADYINGIDKQALIGKILN